MGGYMVKQVGYKSIGGLDDEYRVISRCMVGGREGMHYASLAVAVIEGVEAVVWRLLQISFAPCG